MEEVDLTQKYRGSKVKEPTAQKNENQIKHKEKGETEQAECRGQLGTYEELKKERQEKSSNGYY